MNFTTHRSLRAAALARGAALIGRYRLLVASFAATLGVGLSTQWPERQWPRTARGLPRDLRVGHMVKDIVVPGSTLLPVSRMCRLRPSRTGTWTFTSGTRPTSAGSPMRRETVYTSALYGKPLIPGRWDPLSWQVESEVARENAPIDPDGPAFPVIVFSHGSTNDPIDYANTLELIAGAGFVVAAPAHVNNTQDDERIDYINAQAGKVGSRLVRRAGMGGLRLARGGTSRGAWRTASGTSATRWTSWMRISPGIGLSRTGSTCRMWE